MENENKLIDAITLLAKQTGFETAIIPAVIRNELPQDCFVMFSSYAVLVTTFIKENTVENLNILKDKSEAGLFKVLTIFEQNGMLVDGYLILSLTDKPNEELYGRIREIELDSAICRKHVVWPVLNESEGIWDSRLRYITTLGLPYNTASERPTIENLQLPERVSKILEIYQSKNTYKSVIDYIDEKVNGN